MADDQPDEEKPPPEKLGDNPAAQVVWADAVTGRTKDTPEAAPVTDVSPEKTVPLIAPVSDFRATQGVELTKKLLNILTGSIVILVIYLWWLDSKTSEKVDQLYVNAFTAIEARSSSGPIPGLQSLINQLTAAETDSAVKFPAGTSKKAKGTFDRVTASFHIDPQDAESLASCLAAIKDSPSDGAKTSAPEPAAPSGKVGDSGAAPMSPPESDPRSGLGACVEKLESLRVAAGGPIDTDRLRLMRDFAKDMQENHQGLRTFWLSATQLILVNVLLPLLTALLGYIFGRQSTS